MIKEQIIAYFRTQQCPHCSRYLDDKAVTFLKDEPYVVRVDCSKCGQSIGVAVVSRSRAETRQIMGQYAGYTTPTHNMTLTAKDRKKFAAMPPISASEQLDFHEFLKTIPTAQKQ